MSSRTRACSCCERLGPEAVCDAGQRSADQELADLRVGFDLMGPGEVWIDDVQVYDRWFPKNERDDLMIMSGLAARSLSMGQLGDCQRILSGYWPQFLLEYVPLNERAGGGRPRRRASRQPRLPAATTQARRWRTETLRARQGQEQRSSRSADEGEVVGCWLLDRW